MKIQSEKGCYFPNNQQYGQVVSIIVHLLAFAAGFYLFRLLPNAVMAANPVS